MSEIGIITYPGRLDFPGSSVVKDPPANAGDPRERDVGLIPGVGNGNPLQYSCLENTMDRGAGQATVHRVAKVRHDRAFKPQNMIVYLPLSFF